MIRSRVFRTAGILALAASGSVQAAQTQQAAACLSSQEVRAMTAFFLPTVLNSVVSTCDAHLPADAFLRAKAPALVTKLNAGKEAAWPLAKSAFTKMGDGGSKGEALDKLPDEALRPFIEAMVTTELGPKFKAKDCKNINRIAATLEPLPSENLVALVAEIFGVAMLGDRKTPACPLD